MTSQVVKEDLIQTFHNSSQQSTKITIPKRASTTAIPFSATMPEFVMPNTIDQPQEGYQPPIIMDNVKRNACVVNKPPKGRMFGPQRSERVSLDNGLNSNLGVPEVSERQKGGSCPNLVNRNEAFKDENQKQKLRATKSNDIKPRTLMDNNDPESKIGVPNMFVTSFTHSKPTCRRTEFSNSSPNLQSQAKFQTRRIRSAGFQRTLSCSRSENSFSTLYKDNTVSQILNFLYLGTVETAYNEHTLCKIQVERLVDLSNKMPDEIPAGLKSIASCACPPTTIHSRAKLCISVEDREEEGIDAYFNDINVFIEGARKSGKKVLIFSYDGKSRAPTVVLQYLMTYQDMDLRTAYNWIRRHRPEININIGFQRILERIERRCGYGQSMLFDDLYDNSGTTPKQAWADC